METLKRAIIVAAGVGNRLRPITLETPKPLVRVNGIRMIDTQIRALRNQGIQDIYIVTGYKEEQFREAFQGEPDIHLIQNPHYLEGNNITSLYAAREFLPGSLVLEGDLTILNEKILSPLISKSGYLATWMEHAPEWALEVVDGRISDLFVKGREDAYRLWGVSMWTEQDGALLSTLVKEQFENTRDWSIYWDELALSIFADRFDLGIREVPADALMEIDSLEELAAIDPTYALCSSLT